MNTLSTITVVFASMLLFTACETVPKSIDVNDTARLQEEQFWFQNDGVHLAATIIYPKASTGLGVVFLPGSGPAERRVIRPAAQQMASLGVTVMIFDKRGSGESSGDWTVSSLDDLASDAIAAMTELKARTSINRVGFWTHSQGNWVAIRAADLGAAPDFLIATSGGGASPQESERNAYERIISQFLPADQAQATILVDRYFEYLSGSISRTELDSYISNVSDCAWYDLLGIDRVLVSESNRPNWQWVSDFSPAAGAEKRIFPVLVLLGGADHSIPLDLTITSWNSQLSQNKLTNNRIVTFVGRDHHLRMHGQGHGSGISTDAVIWGEIAQWIVELAH